ncbi:MAG: hypothetical protein HDT28_08840 [Clostridiales bacterium]|nr:hypothetical protein [Clostridiales bacterium]
MRIGIDIDGVLTDTMSFKLKYGTKFFQSNNINLNTYEIRHIFNVSKETEIEFRRRFFKEYYNTSDFLRGDVVDKIDKLHNTGHEIWIITGREETDINGFNLSQSMGEITENWLKMCQIKYDRLYMSVTQKAEFVHEHNIDYYIEDLPYFLDQFFELNFNRCICYDTSYNRYSKYLTMLRAKDWQDIVNIIEEHK